MRLYNFPFSFFCLVYVVQSRKQLRQAKELELTTNGEPLCYSMFKLWHKTQPGSCHGAYYGRFLDVCRGVVPETEMQCYVCEAHLPEAIGETNMAQLSKGFVSVISKFASEQVSPRSGKRERATTDEEDVPATTEQIVPATTEPARMIKKGRFAPTVGSCQDWERRLAQT